MWNRARKVRCKIHPFANMSRLSGHTRHIKKQCTNECDVTMCECSNATKPTKTNKQQCTSYMRAAMDVIHGLSVQFPLVSSQDSGIDAVGSIGVTGAQRLVGMMNSMSGARNARTSCSKSNLPQRLSQAAKTKDICRSPSRLHCCQNQSLSLTETRCLVGNWRLWRDDTVVSTHTMRFA